jgi:hypothetical protein
MAVQERRQMAEVGTWSLPQALQEPDRVLPELMVLFLLFKAEQLVSKSATLELLWAQPRHINSDFSG